MLKDRELRKLQPKAKTFRKSDHHGLCLEVHPDGRKFWRYRYRFAGKATMASYGQYPTVSLALARSAHAADVQTLKAGKNPNLERHAEAAKRSVSQANTFSAIAEEWLTKQKKGWTEGNAIKERGRLVNHAFPVIGKLPIKEIGVAHIKHILKNIQDRGTLDTAHRVRQTMAAVFHFAIANEYTEKNPAAALKRTLPAHYKKQYSFITDQRLLGEVLRAIHAFGGHPSTACALRLAPMLFLRPGELRQGEWKEVDLKARLWTIPPYRMKLRKDKKLNAKSPSHVVPLPTQAVSILRELFEITGNGRFLFPGARSPDYPMSNATLNAALRRLGFVPEVIQPHGFRHTASTALNEMDRFPPHVIDVQLGHVKKGMEAIYNKAQHLAMRREVMQAWADRLDELRTNTPI